MTVLSWTHRALMPKVLAVFALAPLIGAGGIGIELYAFINLFS
ncbi:MAG: hypothetical protein ACE5GT_02775 [Rhodospirillales bacterium]